MELGIEKRNLIRNVQRQFNEIYPFLKIEFFNPYTAIQENDLQKPSKKNALQPLNNTEKFRKSGIINIDPKRTAAQMENDFRKKFDLSIKIFRKSGSLWIEITLTDSWTLEKQNEEGEFMSSPFVHK